MIDKCSEATFDPLIKVEERGTKATIRNPNRGKFIKRKIDGCMITNQLAADWIVTEPTVGDLIIELKGKNVEHAFRQVAATIDFWRAQADAQTRISALIVCVRCPKAASRTLTAQSDLRRKHGIKLKICTGNRHYALVDLL